MRKIPDALLLQLIAGRNLRGTTLREELGQAPKLLIFTRHSGCLFCGELIAEVRQQTIDYPNLFPPVLFFSLSSQVNLDQLYQQQWPVVSVISDPARKFYRGFEIPRGSWRHLFSGPVWQRGRQAVRRGFFISKPVGDVWQMPGIFLVRGAEILWSHSFRHAADHPDWNHVRSEIFPQFFPQESCTLARLA